MACKFVVHHIGYMGVPSHGPLAKAYKRAKAAGKLGDKKFPVSRRGFTVAMKYAAKWQGSVSLDCGRSANDGNGTVDAVINLATCRKNKGQKTSRCGWLAVDPTRPQPHFRTKAYREAEQMVLAGRKR